LLILIDSREQHPWAFPKFDTHRCTLETGDYSVVIPQDSPLSKYSDESLDYTICIDRKGCTAELFQNVTQARFKNEIDRMGKFRHKFLILEFSMDDILRFPYGSSIPKRRWRYLRVKPEFVLGYLTNLMLSGISVIFAGDSSNAQRICLNILKKVYLNSTENTI